MALWDLVGQKAGLPLYKLLGAYTDKLPIIAIGGYYEEGKSNDDLVEEIKKYRTEGIGGIKMKVGSLGPDEDLERFIAARSSIGDNFIIACDANMGWSLGEAIRFVQGVEKSGLRLDWLEEPIEWRHQYDGLARLRQLTSIPINAGQSEVSATECRRLLDQGCVDIINLDLTVCGGITEWRRIAFATQLWPGVRLGHHEEPIVAMHLLASVPNGYCVECFPNPARDPIWSDLPSERPPIEDGYIHLTDTPGIGMFIDWSYVEKWRADR
jgi:D-arabinonate dehydratase